MEKSDTRMRTFFAFFPVRIYLGDETRWLQQVNTIEVYSLDNNMRSWSWKVVEFIDYPLNRNDAGRIRWAGYKANEGDTREDVARKNAA